MVKYLIDRTSYVKQTITSSRRKPFAIEMLQQRNEGIVVSKQVQNDDRLRVNAELDPSQYLEQLLQSTKPTWKCDEGI